MRRLIFLYVYFVHPAAAHFLSFSAKAHNFSQQRNAKKYVCANGNYSLMNSWKNARAPCFFVTAHSWWENIDCKTVADCRWYHIGTQIAAQMGNTKKCHQFPFKIYNNKKIPWIFPRIYQEQQIQTIKKMFPMARDLWRKCQKWQKPTSTPEMRSMPDRGHWLPSPEKHKNIQRPKLSLIVLLAQFSSQRHTKCRLRKIPTFFFLFSRIFHSFVSNNIFFPFFIPHLITRDNWRQKKECLKK